MIVRIVVSHYEHLKEGGLFQNGQMKISYNYQVTG